MKIKRIIELIKRCNDQPIIFHRLYGHLAHALKSVDYLHELNDDWSRMVIYGVVRSKYANQGLEGKVMVFLKGHRPPVESSEVRLRIWIVLYYMKNRTVSQLNHMIVFELVSNFMGMTSFIDGLIISVLAIATTGPSFGAVGNKKLREECIEHLLEQVKKKNLSLMNRAMAIPCYFGHEKEPPLVVDAVMEENLMSVVILERVCFYAKFAKDSRFVKQIVPDDHMFIESLRKYINRQFMRDNVKRGCAVSECVVEDTGVFDAIRRAYGKAGNKQRFLSKVVEFVTGLDNEQ
ncbi:hypothetical protein CWI42_090640 [Ordospora colligata]|uniref:Uncharacterized protein n=1 Tax=Ordospora colligata OC4 TaxID=1354746 RepID=A0A0B2UIS7_9MICR|nr:uncharacterized protein M896_090640 [Ordospora colligata OC4]KHN69139.1 hypothetical protein M896_090640 [Ordospora colligata OC4]TBU14594.1 hypothetical protein CWI41_090640 [Ordospora colligata]TBU14788.1 hypothetical protein CWI40_090650 [Ordospora colligata]TBU18222.1 hypothetical protein CWI42_090640 [Ordospora colligata]